VTSAKVERSLALLSERCVDVVTRDDLAQRLASGRPLRVKLGIDPSGPLLHLGHAVVLRKLREFQDLGHIAILLVGDFTAQIGDPTGRAESRKPRTREDIERDMKTYVDQAALILDMRKTEIVYNSSWLSELTLADFIRLCSNVTVARLLERDYFKERYDSGAPIGLHEFLYPISVAYDSVVVKADVELGGTEQLFNLLMGRHLQEQLAQPPQICMTLPVLEGTDGVQRMGKSLNNFIALREAPESMFGKVMSLPDALLGRYWQLATTASKEEIAANLALPPRDSKQLLAEAIVRLYHGDSEAAGAREHFDKTVVRKELPETMREYPLAQSGAVSAQKLLVLTGLAGSNREAARLIEQGAIKIDGERVNDGQRVERSWNGKVLQKGNHQFVRITQK
jgi:tyrosyl-tRNA synthetase